jgi:hypothetical protein
VLCRRSLLGSPCPCKLARQIAFIRSGGHAISCTACKLARPGRSSIVWRRYKTGILIVADAVWGCYLSPGTTMVCETRIFAEIGLFDTKLQRHEDWDWLLRLTARYDLAGRAAAACAQRLKRCNRAPLGLTNTRQSNPTCEGAHAAAPTGRADRRLRKLALPNGRLEPVGWRQHHDRGAANPFGPNIITRHECRERTRNIPSDPTSRIYKVTFGEGAHAAAPTGRADRRLRKLASPNGRLEPGGLEAAS